MRAVIPGGLFAGVLYDVTFHSQEGGTATSRCSVSVPRLTSAQLSAVFFSRGATSRLLRELTPGSMIEAQPLAVK